MRKYILLLVGIVAGIGLLFAGISVAQDSACKISQLKNPPRVMYQCANGLVIEAENLAVLTSFIPSADAPPASVTVRERGLLISLPTGQGPFQIRTPHAIASVRGTVFVVDATAYTTSVFVVKGAVEVATKVGYETALVNAGEGIVVSVGTPLVARTWTADKVAALLGRFNR